MINSKQSVITSPTQGEKEAQESSKNINENDSIEHPHPGSTENNELVPQEHPHNFKTPVEGIKKCDALVQK